MSDNLVRVEFDKCKAMTDDAVLLDIDGTNYWLAFSTITESSGFVVGQKSCWVVIPYWVAEAKCLTDYAEEYDG